MRFGVFELDLVSEELFRRGIRVKIQGQPLQVLAVLLERPGEIITREELRKRVWDDDTFVDFDHSLNISINKLRDTLGDSAATPRFIETLPRRGYRFLAPVSAEVPPGSSPTTPDPAGQLSAASEASLAKPVLRVTPVNEGGSSWLRPSIWIAIAGGAVLLVFFALWLWPQRDRFGTSHRRPMLAVLPFDDLTGDPHNEYFVAGLHDELISQLGRLDASHLGVIARSSAVQYSNTRKSIDQIGRELHVDYILNGAVRQGAGHFRITAALIKVSDQDQLWVETYEPEMGEILSLQKDVAQKVSRALSMEFQPATEKKMREATTQNAGAYEAYLKGRFLWYQETHQSLQQSIAEYQRALALDPNYAAAYVGMADAYNVLGGYGFEPPEEAFPKGKAAAARALELAPGLSDAYGSLAFAGYYYDWDWGKSEELFRKALALNPNNQVAHEFYSSFLHLRGRLEEAESENRAAQQLDPVSGWLHDDLGWMLLSQHKPEAAIVEFQRATDLLPNFPAGHLSLAVGYMRARQFDKALAEVRKADALGGEPTRVLEIMGSVQALSGDTAGAQATVDKLRTGAVAGRVSPYSVALIYTAMGKKSEALDWLERAYQEKDPWIVWIGVLTEWQSLRTEPRFLALLQKLKL